MRYLIFGGTGSLGKKLIERFLHADYSTNIVHVCSRDEAKHWTIKNEYTEEVREHRLKFHVGDVRDQQRVAQVIAESQPNVIIIAAALKQVDTCELSVAESVKTNIVGTQNIIDAVNDYAKTRDSALTRVLFVSTDKACSPVNVYGMCKSISERIVTNTPKDSSSSVSMVCTRYGNVLESRGSILPLFKYQAANKDELTVTDPEMTRFLMTLDDSVDLINRALNMKRIKHGQTVIPYLRSMKIGDLAEIFSEQSGKPVKIVGVRPGEKKHETLINLTESMRLQLDYDMGDYVLNSSMSPITNTNPFTYSSNDPQCVMKKSELKEYLTALGILDAPLKNFKGLEIEEIKID